MEEIEEQIIYYYDVIMTSNNVEPQHKYLTYASNTDIPNLTYVKVNLKNQKAKGIIFKKRAVEHLEVEIHKVKIILSICPESLPLAYFSTAVFIKHYYFLPFSQVFKFIKPHPKDIKRIEPSFENLNLEIELSNQQQIAYNQIVNSQTTVLLFGETGSGKTRIYKKLIADALLNNGDIVFLVPEINIVPQTIKRLEKHFNYLIAPWHSKVNTESKETILAKIEIGLIKIAVGTISTIFLPFKNLQLIVIDEEHSESYSLGNHEKTFFSGRESAIYLGNQLNIKVIVGSATPLITSYTKFDIVRLKRDKSLNAGNQISFISDKKKFINFALKKAREEIENGKKVLWFVPVKGNFKYASCLSCGLKIECKSCSTGMRVYLDDTKLKCNRCGKTENVPKFCPKCNGELKLQNVGTVEVTKILKKAFPNKNIVYIDGDNTRKIDQLEEILEAFENNKIDILVGTQIMSKGHDFPDLNLVIVSDIDNSLDFLDFQAYERSLRTLVQLVGRSGRKEAGEVLVYTKFGEFFENFVNDYEKFLLYEIEARQGLFPPFVNFGRIVIKSAIKEEAENLLNKLETLIINKFKYKIFISGEADIKKLNNKYRFHIIIKDNVVKKLINLWEELVLLLLPENKNQHEQQKLLRKLSFQINPDNYE